MWATTYYVSATGNDTHDGTSHLQAWKTTNQVNAAAALFNPGDDVLFKCGDTWTMGGANPFLNITWDGTPTDPAVIGAYYLDTDGVTEIRGVQGAKPIFDGNNAYPVSGETGSLVYSNSRRFLVYENLFLRRSKARGLHVNGGSTQNYSIRIIGVDVEQTYNEGLVLYAVDTGLVQDCDISYTSNKRLAGLTGTAGLSLRNSCANVVLKQNRLHENYGHGILVYTLSSQCTVENNLLYNSGYPGLNYSNIFVSDGSSNCDIRSNVIFGKTDPALLYWHEDPGQGIRLDDAGSSLFHQRNRIYNNLIAHCYKGIAITSSSTLEDTFVYHNTLVDNLTNFSLEGPFSNCAVRNNIIWSITPGDSIPFALLNGGGLSLDHNFWSVTPIPAAQGEGDVYEASPLLVKTTGWRTIPPAGLSAADCKLHAASLAANAGVALGATYAIDITGTARPRGAGWDMGAWELESNSQMDHLSFNPVPVDLFYTETTSNLIAQIDCQAINSDVLLSLRIHNTGTAIAVRDLINLQLWHLTGGAGSLFDPSQAVVVGTLAPVSEAAWVVTLNLVLQDHDTLYITADIPSGAKGGTTVQTSLPPGGAVFQYSQPLETTPLLNPYAQTIRNPTRLFIDAFPLGTVNLIQNQTSVPLGQVTLHNVSGALLNINSLKLDFQAKSGLEQNPGQCFSRLWLARESTPVSVLGPPFAQGALFTFSPAITLANQENAVLEVYADVLASPALEGFRFLVSDASAINAGQIQSTPAENQLFPLTVADANIRPPSAEAVFSSFPNPFRPSSGPMRVAYYLESAGEAELSVWTLSGRRVATLEQADKPAGLYEIPWDGKNEQGRAVVSGPYLLRLELRYANAPSQRFSRKFVVAR